LPYLDFYFLPHFNKPWNIINLVGLNIKKWSSIFNKIQIKSSLCELF
jgi:hypothetical protein